MAIMDTGLLGSLIETVIRTACPGAQGTATANPLQKIYAAADAKEAKLAYDVLIAYGIEAKFYAENQGAKLYVTLPGKKHPITEPALAEATAYAAFLKQLKTQLDQSAIAAPAYSLNFAAAPGGRQVTIHMAAQPAQTDISQPVAAPSAAPIHAAKAAPAASFAPRTEYDQLFAGPESIQAPGKKKKINYENKSDSLWKQFKFYIRGNIVAALLTLGACLAVLIVIISMFVASKGFLCPDFATADKEKNQAWYCK